MVSPDDDAVRVLQEELRGASDGFLMAAEAIIALERQKRDLAPGADRFPELAAEVLHEVEHLLRIARSQHELALDVTDDRRRRALVPIEKTPTRADLGAILRDWRAAERRLSEADPHTDESRAATEEIERLKLEYERAFAQAFDRNRGWP